MIVKIACHLIFYKFLLEPYAGQKLMLCNAQFHNGIKNKSNLLTFMFFSLAGPKISHRKYKLQEPFVLFLCWKHATQPLHFIKNE